eukprot:maker-scaffold_41-snap-gene-2.28-mRNA-1 protein AED:0.00 eAED:0.00 QI:1808/0/0.5/1/0/0/2/104/76
MKTAFSLTLTTNGAIKFRMKLLLDNVLTNNRIARKSFFLFVPMTRCNAAATTTCASVLVNGKDSLIVNIFSFAVYY